MSQGYNASFARIYDRRWGFFASQVAHRLRAFYEAQPAAEGGRTLLDVGCGAGHLASDFLQAGYSVTGLDLSPSMLEYARQRCAPFVETGQARFVEGDAAGFHLDERFGLVVSTFDMLNHLPDLAALRGAFGSVYRVLAPGGLFIFDLNTAVGLAERWNSVSVEDTEELFLLNRSIYLPEERRAYTRITGFTRSEQGSYDRLDQIVYNTAFALRDVADALRAAGWPNAYAASLDSLETPLPEPEIAARVFFVARLP
jgi:SAM-dependent methyltransferase